MMTTEFLFDPGHGGNDPGAVGYGLKEADVVLDLCLKTGNYLLQNYTGVRIHYTRTSDTTMSLTERTNLANLKHVDFMYSFHNNSHTTSTAHGFETFVYTSPSTKSVAAQNIIHDEIMKFLKGYGITDRGKKKANFHIVRESKMPAVLAEYLFISNKKENDLLSDDNFRSKLAEATAKGIAKAWGLKEKPKPTPQTKPVVSKPSNTLYKVQIGAFSEKVNAEKLAAQAKAKGFKTYIEEESK
jgi:N-acetylmuramoyl-L-alanine amidase